jgi:hypothetical protein
MKKLIALVATLAVGATAFGQGSILFNNVGTGVNSPVRDQNGVVIPAGVGFTVELFAGATADSLSAVTGTTTFVAPGTFLGSQRVLTGLAPGSYPFFEVRVWENQGGTFTSYEAARDGLAQFGSSNPFQLAGTTTGLGNPTGVPPSPAPALVGMPSFNLTVIPEPSTYALLALGAAALFLRRRK